jgi:hypothetical protein
MMVSRLESGKDTLQEGVESAAIHAGRIMAIVAGAVRDVTHEIGEFATEVFEMREASQRAEADRADPDVGRVDSSGRGLQGEDTA